MNSAKMKRTFMNMCITLERSYKDIDTSNPEEVLAAAKLLVAVGEAKVMVSKVSVVDPDKHLKQLAYAAEKEKPSVLNLRLKKPRSQHLGDGTVRAADLAGAELTRAELNQFFDEKQNGPNQFWSRPRRELVNYMVEKHKVRLVD